MPERPRQRRQWRQSRLREWVRGGSGFTHGLWCERAAGLPSSPARCRRRRRCDWVEDGAGRMEILMTVSKFASICTMVGAAGGRPGSPGIPGAGGRRCPSPRPSPRRSADPGRGAAGGRGLLDAGGLRARGLAAPREGEVAGDQRGDTVLDVAGSGHWFPAPRGSTAEVFPRHRGRAAGSTRAVGARAGARPRLGSEVEGRGAARAVSVWRCVERGGGPGRGWGSAGRKAGSRSCTGEDGSQV